MVWTLDIQCESLPSSVDTSSPSCAHIISKFNHCSWHSKFSILICWSSLHLRFQTCVCFKCFLEQPQIGVVLPGERTDRLWEALSGNTSEKRGVHSHTGGERILEMLWSLHMPWIAFLSPLSLPRLPCEIFRATLRRFPSGNESLDGGSSDLAIGF